MSKMKNYSDQIQELELSLLEDVERSIMSLVSIKFNKQIKGIVKISIKDVIKDAIDETIWINEIKDRVKKDIHEYIYDYKKLFDEERKQLNIRMDFIEKRFIDLLGRFDEVIYSIKD